VENDGYFDDRTVTYARRVGERLRAIRRQKGLSLQEVEMSSHEEFKASVLGAYERGERAISVPRLQRLARFYHVPVDQLLPRYGDDGPAEPIPDASPAPSEPRPVTIDLARLRLLDRPEGTLLMRYVEMIQVAREDFNGKMLTVRRDDLRALACILDTPIDRVAVRLDEMGLCLTP
jgi:transcriptional regulator with XRE-family HTH domain